MKPLAILTALSLALAGPVTASSVTVAEISIAAPAGWAVSEVEHGARITASDGAAAIVVLDTGDTSRAQAWARLEAYARTSIRAVSLDPARRTRFRGTNITYAVGRGLLLAVLETRAHRFASILVVSQTSAHDAALTAALGTIAPVQAADTVDPFARLFADPFARLRR